MSFNLDVIDTGVSANDGQGDPLRTAFSKSYNNDHTLSGQIVTLSGAIELDYVTRDAVVSGHFNTRLESTGENLLSQITGNDGDILDIQALTGSIPVSTYRSFDNLSSGQYVEITGTKTSAISEGKFNILLTECHYGTGTSFTSSPYSFASGSFYRIDYPVKDIGSPYETEKTYSIHATDLNSLKIQRNKDPLNEAVSGNGTTTTVLNGDSYHYLKTNLTEY